jgi:hypothetical protein
MMARFHAPRVHAISQAMQIDEVRAAGGWQPPPPPPQGGYGGMPPHGQGPPPYGGGGYGPNIPQPPVPTLGDDVNTTLPVILGLLTLPCACFFSAIPIVLAVQAKNFKNQGDTAQARAKARAANIWAIVLIVLGVLGWGAALVLGRR